MSDLLPVCNRQEVVALQPLGSDRHISEHPDSGGVSRGSEAVSCRVYKNPVGLTDLHYKSRRAALRERRARRQWQRQDRDWENAMFQSDVNRIAEEENRLIQLEIGLLGSGNSKGDGPECFVCSKEHYPYCKKPSGDQSRGLCRLCGRKHFPFCKKGSKPGSVDKLQEALVDSIAKEDAKEDVAVDVEKLDTEIAELKVRIHEATEELQRTKEEGDMLPEEVFKGMKYVVEKGVWEWKMRLFVMLCWVFLLVVSWALWTMRFIPVTYTWKFYADGVYIGRGTDVGPLPPIVAVYPLGLSLIFMMMTMRLGPFKRRAEIYSYAGPYVHDSVDRRADVMSLGEVKHKARYCWFEFRKGREVNKFLVSSELLSQLLAPTNVDASYDSRIVWERMNRSARSLHSVSIDRWLSVSQLHVVPNTVRVAYAAYQSLYRTQAGAPALGKYLPFRLGPAT